MSLQVWLPLNRDPNMTPDITSYRKESGVTLTEDTDGWYKIQDTTHASGSRWGIYYDFAVKPNTTYTLYVYSKSTTGIKASINIQSFAVVTWPTQRDTNTTSDEKLTTYSWTTGPSDSIARVYLALITTATKANDYVFYKEPRVYEAPQNQGIANLVVTNNGVLINDEGKLGKCYYFDGGAHYLSFVKSDLIKNTQPWSVSAWVKLINGKTYYPLFWAGASTPNASGVGGVSLHGGYLNRLECSDGTHTLDTTIGTALSYDEWYHITLTYDGLNITKYINGALNASKEWTYGFGNQSQFQVGGFWGPDLYGYINDFRIYDHALSEREIKELARGLVLHYPLNNNGFGNENLATCTTDQYNIPFNASNFHYFWINGGTLEPSTTYTFSAEVEVIESMDYCTIFNYSPGDYTGAQYNTFPADGKRHSWTFTTSETALGLIGYAGVAGRDANHSAIYRNIKLEKGDKATPYIPRSNESLYIKMGLNNKVIYDISGLANNGTVTGALSVLSDTVRYGVSTYMPTAALIKHPRALDNSDQEWTCCAWVKLDSTATSGQSLNDFNYSNRIIHAANGTPLLYLNAGANDYYMYGSQAVSAGEWTHIAFVFKNSTGLRNVYVNGVLTNSYGPNQTSTPSGIPLTVTIGTNFAGYISDYREYATALSANDIKELYEMGVSE